MGLTRTLAAVGKRRPHVCAVVVRAGIKVHDTACSNGCLRIPLYAATAVLMHAFHLGPQSIATARAFSAPNLDFLHGRLDADAFREILNTLPGDVAEGRPGLGGLCWLVPVVGCLYMGVSAAAARGCGRERERSTRGAKGSEVNGGDGDAKSGREGRLCEATGMRHRRSSCNPGTVLGMNEGSCEAATGSAVIGGPARCRSSSLLQERPCRGTAHCCTASNGALVVLLPVHHISPCQLQSRPA